MLETVVILIAILLAALPLASLASARASAFAESLATPVRSGVQVVFTLSWISVILLALVQMTVVILVSVFSVSLVWLQEATMYLFGAIFLLGAGAVLLEDEHVRVDILYSRWPKRRRALIDLLGLTLFVLPVCALVIVASGPYVAQSWAELERSSEPSGLHLVYLLKSMIPAFGVVLGLSAFAKAQEAARTLRESGG